MDRFAFIVHPIAPRRDVARKYPLWGKALSPSLIEAVARIWPPVYLGRVSGVESSVTGKVIEGEVWACPLSAEQMSDVPLPVVYRKIARTGQAALKRGARVVGLGAHTAVVGDGGVTIARRLGAPVTTGNSLTVAMAVRALERASEDQMGNWREATVAVVGATGTIGWASALTLAPKVGRLLLIARGRERLARVARQAEEAGAQNVRTAQEVDALREADLVLSVTSATDAIIYSRHLKRGAIVCDVAMPPDVAPHVSDERDDVRIIKGGVVDVPGEVRLDFDFGLPPGTAYACMAEAMALTLEGRFESFSLGKKIEVERVREIDQIAERHGFRLSAESVRAIGA